MKIILRQKLAGNLMRYLLRKLKKNYHRLLFLSIIIFISGCCPYAPKGKKIADQLTRKEKEDLNSFFFHLLLENSGIYVLLGSKPITHTMISPYTPEEEEKNYEQLFLNLNIKNREEKKPAFRDRIFSFLFKRSPYLFKDSPFYIQQWDKVKDRIKMYNYLIVTRPHFSGPFSRSLYFVNITSTIAVFQKHYPLFKEIMGSDFDPLDAIYNLEDPTSLFWDKITKNYLAYGLLFGFGEENSYFFNYWCREGIDKKRDARQPYFTYAPFDDYDNHRWLCWLNCNYQNFPLPVFRHFENDPIIEKYKQERERIKKMYRGKDPLVVTLQRLTEKKNNMKPFFLKKENFVLKTVRKYLVIKPHYTDSD
jgi:hypothetical protein